MKEKKGLNKFVLLLFIIVLFFGFIPINVTSNSAGCDQFCQSHYGKSGGCRFFGCGGSSWCFPSTNGLCNLAEGTCCCSGVDHIEGQGCGDYTVPPYSCDGHIDKTTGKCSKGCGAHELCDGKSPSSVYYSSVYPNPPDYQCSWCDGDCSIKVDNNKPCDSAVCTGTGWDNSSCTSSTPSPTPPSPTPPSPTPPSPTPPSPTPPSPTPPSPTPPGPTPPVYYYYACSGTTACVPKTSSTPQASECSIAIDCCKDGDCGSIRCSGAWKWKPGAPSEDLSQSGNYCCGDDGSGDLGPPQQDYLCVNDGGYHWLKGSEDHTYLKDTLLFCNNKFHFCLDNPGYSGVETASACENDCDYYCELNTKKWVDRRTSPYLSEPLIPDEPVDQVKNNMQGSNGCCPGTWCWNGTICEENQIDEACDPYIYNLSNVIYRCKDGDWSASKKARDWSNKDYGYCPNNSDCFISCDSYDNNYHPDTYFSASKPQCILNNQYILDNYCYNRSWITRTSLMATKMVNSMITDSHNNFEISCGDYKSVVNDYSYLIDSIPVEKFLLKNCNINGQPVPCTNNFCLIRNLEDNQTIFGTSLNNPSSSGDYAFSKVLGLSSCSDSPPPNSLGTEWDYNSCASNIFYNPAMEIVLYSDEDINLVEDMGGWTLFKHFFSHPFSTIINLIKGNQIYYENKVTNTKLEFPILNDAPAYGKMFILNNEPISSEGILEYNKFDPATKISGNYMIISYEGIPNVCQKIEDSISYTNETKCVENNGKSIVTDAGNYLVSKWFDLTTKVKRQ